MTPADKIKQIEENVVIRTELIKRLDLLKAKIETLYFLHPGDLGIETHARNISEPRKLFAYIACKEWGVTTDDASYYIACRRSNVSTQSNNWRELCDRYPTYAAMTNIVLSSFE